MLSRVFVFMLIFSLGVVWILSMTTSTYDKTFTLVLYEEETNDVIDFANVKVFPNFPLKDGPTTAGKGHFIFKFDTHTPAFFIIKKDGYITKYNLTFLSPYEQHVVYLKKDPKYEPPITDLNETASFFAKKLVFFLQGKEGKMEKQNGIQPEQIRNIIIDLSLDKFTVLKENIIIEDQEKCNELINSVFDKNILCAYTIINESIDDKNTEKIEEIHIEIYTPNGSGKAKTKK